MLSAADVQIRHVDGRTSARAPNGLIGHCTKRTAKGRYLICSNVISTAELFITVLS